ncbi:MAG: DUF503 domain-containing protein [Phycisphaerales bacterium]|jgi:uncharacterized protein YlxP (DUF503 family)|nr:DUF503 domain-containing protein [Phycisphaerales bacterium]
MNIGILQLDLVVHGAESLKDKRRIVRSLRDRLHREHMASVSEVGALDALNHAVLGVAVVAPDGRRAGEVLDAISAKVRRGLDAELAITGRRILNVETLDPADDMSEAEAASLASELGAYADSEGPEHAGTEATQ